MCLCKGKNLVLTEDHLWTLAEAKTCSFSQTSYRKRCRGPSLALIDTSRVSRAEELLRVPTSEVIPSSLCHWVIPSNLQCLCILTIIQSEWSESPKFILRHLYSLYCLYKRYKLMYIKKLCLHVPVSQLASYILITGCRGYPLHEISASVRSNSQEFLRPDLQQRSVISKGHW